MLAPHTGEALIRTRLRILVRSALLLAMGTGLALLGPPVGVILGYYAAWFALALPVLGWRPRNLFILAAVIAVVGPVIKLGTPVALSHLGMTAYPTSGDGNAAVVSFLITGFYPGALWMAYIFLGLGLSRLDWSRSRNLWRLAAVGALCAVIGYGAGWSVSRVVNPDKPNAYHLVSAAVGALCAVIGYGAGWSVAGSSIRTSPTPTTWSPPRTPSSASTGRVGPRSRSARIERGAGRPTALQHRIPRNRPRTRTRTRDRRTRRTGGTRQTRRRLIRPTAAPGSPPGAAVRTA